MTLFPTLQTQDPARLLKLAWSALRQSWKRDWCGLDEVLTRCCEYLNINTDQLSAQEQALYAAARAVAQSSESQALKRFEPPYHNRLHTADVMVTISLQARIESDRLGHRDQAWLLACLLTALAHDFKHPGQVNAHTSDIEQQSFMALHALLHGVPPTWMACVEYALLQSDFSLAAHNHGLVKGLAFEWTPQWLAVLLNEADVMASGSQLFGEELGRALAQEWRLINFSGHNTVATPAGRQAFLKGLLFSSYSSSVLNFPQEVRAQLE